MGFDNIFLLNILVIFIIFEMFYDVAATNKAIFCVKNITNLASHPMAPKIQISTITLNEVCSGLPSKHFSKSFDIFQQGL